MNYERPIKVVLSCTGDYEDEQNVQFLNIEEDFQGRDLMTYVCPKCGQEHKSYRLG